MSSPNGKIALAMSGGIDSSVAGALLLEEGWEVVGVTLQLRDPSIFGDNAKEVPEQAREATRQLGIGHHVLDCISDFERLVLAPAWDDYVACRTPSPCLKCNEGIKFGILLDWAMENGCAALATGHYVQLAREDGQTRLLRGRDRNKDQAYFLAGLSQKQLTRLVFPLGGHDKLWVREKAHKLGLHCADRKESQDACFLLPDKTFQETLQEKFGSKTPSKIGDILDWNGKRLAPHNGIHNFTVGQRRGVGVGTGAKAWVRLLDPETGDVCLTNDEKDLYGYEFTVSGLSWTTCYTPAMPLECEVQVRHRGPQVPATIFDLSNARGRVTLHRAVRSIAPGQATVLYNGDWAIGRGWIDSGRQRD
ncbi:MAG: tRNA 2-thiouridine(34) synthase MnmA [Holophagaceae bacterium]|nr:tRNA 2-thiouridine(34) synthase MnmA [Holophagaceae bacterium]